MSLMDSDLDHLLKHKIPFSEQHLIRIVYNSLCSLQFIHQANVMHRDVKSANILINSDCNAIICDFGLSRTIPSSFSDLNGFNTMSIRYYSKVKSLVGHQKQYIS